MDSFGFVSSGRVEGNDVTAAETTYSFRFMPWMVHMQTHVQWNR